MNAVCIDCIYSGDEPLQAVTVVSGMAVCLSHAEERCRIAWAQETAAKNAS